jgi:subtilisin family serine protease
MSIIRTVTQSFQVTNTPSGFIDYGLTLMNIPSHWLKSEGQGIGVAVIDTGVDRNHNNLRENVKLVVDFTADNNPTDGVGHGTHVSGIIGARGDGIGIVGIAPRCNLYCLKALDYSGAGDESSILGALKWVLVNHVSLGIKLVNMSLGTSTALDTLIPVLTQLKAEGVIVVCSAGNNGEPSDPTVSSISYPAKYSSMGLCISVGAIDQYLTRASFSSTGQNEIDFVGPGVSAMSCLPNNHYGRLSGTSMAAPAITGLIALLLGANAVPHTTGQVVDRDMVYNVLRTFTVDLGTTGKDLEYGWGFPIWPNLPTS